MIPRATHKDDQKSQEDNIPLDLTLELSMCVKALVFFYNTSEFYQLVRVSVFETATKSSANLLLRREVLTIIWKTLLMTAFSYRTASRAWFYLAGSEFGTQSSEGF
ncbi:hypothetical protein YC2023_042115 [Brassica napus]